MDVTQESRTAIARAEFFLALAEGCDAQHRLEFEAYLEATIVFARAAIHRAKQAAPPSWWSALGGNPSVEFFRNERDHLLKEAPPKINQVVRLGVQETVAAASYYYDDVKTPATETVQRHLLEIRARVAGFER